jgi:hypothetical protein
MTMRERFTIDEWTLATHVPFDAFIFAAAADKHVDQSEITAFLNTVRRASEIRDPLHRELALFWAEASQERIAEELRFQMNETASEMSARIDRTKPMLHTHLSHAEYQGFVLSLAMSCMAIAAASTTKKGIFRKKEAISPEEMRGVTAFILAWDVSPAALQGQLVAAG